VHLTLAAIRPKTAGPEGVEHGLLRASAMTKDQRSGIVAFGD
jgi:hypothetical protein